MVCVSSNAVGHRPFGPWVLLIAVAGAAGPAVASEALAKKHACAACHQVEHKLVGPAWKEVAARYADGSVTAAQLAAAIRTGSNGRWGAMAMPPQTQVPEADLQQIATWVLGGGK